MMKKILTIAVATFGLAIRGGAEPVMVDITFKDDRQVRAFLVSADAANIKYSVDKSGQGSTQAPRDQIKILQTHAPESYTEAEDNYRIGEFELAEEQFRELANEYAPIAAIEDDIGSMSRYFYLKSLKANGKLAQLDEEINALKGIAFALSETYGQDAAWLQPWGMIGKEKWEELSSFVSRYEEVDEDLQEAKLSPPFKVNVPRSKLAELSYFRALSNEKKGNPEAAIKDYYRAFTLNRGSDNQIAREAMLALMKIIHKDNLENPTFANRIEMYTLTSFYKTSFGKGELPSEYASFLMPPPELAKQPDTPEPEPEEKKPEDKPAPDPPAGEKPAMP